MLSDDASLVILTGDASSHRIHGLYSIRLELNHTRTFLFSDNNSTRLSFDPGELSGFGHLATILEKDILHVNYSFEPIPNRVKIEYLYVGDDVKNGDFIIPASANRCVDLWTYLKYIAKVGDTIIIDSPEAFLHPINQRKMARLIAKLVNGGIMVVISTDNDFMIREFNNLIMLSYEFSDKAEIMEKFGYIENEILAHDKVQAYYFNQNKISPITIENFGIEVESIDAAIGDLNDSNLELYSLMIASGN